VCSRTDKDKELSLTKRTKNFALRTYQLRKDCWNRGAFQQFQQIVLNQKHHVNITTITINR